MGHHAVTERRKTGSASDLVEVESHDFNRGSVSISSVNISTEEESEEEKRQKILKKLSPEERRILGIEE